MMLCSYGEVRLQGAATGGVAQVLTSENPGTGHLRHCTDLLSPQSALIGLALTGIALAFTCCSSYLQHAHLAVLRTVAKRALLSVTLLCQALVSGGT